MKEPMGLFSSLKPLRLRRIALARALIPSSCPTTRWARTFSSSSSFCISLSANLETGMPVHLETISATNSSSTISFSNRSFLVSVSFCNSFCSSFSLAAIVP